MPNLGNVEAVVAVKKGNLSDMAVKAARDRHENGLEHGVLWSQIRCGVGIAL
jgi:hypothetical protein